MTKTWDKPSIQTLIHSNPKALHRAIIKIYERQTADEQDLDQTIEHNGIGFNGIDAEIMSSFAKQLMTRGFLSPKQTVIAQKKMPKYWKQILQLINEKAGQ
jgi:hypothetical protein